MNSMYGYSSSYHSSYASSKANEIKLKDKDQPLDTVSYLIWDPYRNDPGFIAASWDGYVRYYMVKQGTTTSSSEVQKVWSMFLQHPVLCCDINPNNVLLAGLATGDIAAISLENSQVHRVGGHDAPICGIFWLKDKGCLLTLGFDNLVKFWTLEGGNQPQAEIQLPLKTHTAAMDYPYLLIGSCDSTISIVNLKNLPNCSFPKRPQEYLKCSIQKFSKYTSSRILGDAMRICLGTVDSRCVTAGFRQNNDGTINIQSSPMVSRSQKRGSTRGDLYGQVNCVDIGYYNREIFSLIGGTEDLTSYNLNKKSKGNTYCTNSSMVGAATACRMSPRYDYLVYATGTDWCKGIHELENLKKPKINLVKLSTSDLKELTSK